MSWSPPFGFKDHGDSIHAFSSKDERPHLAGEIQGEPIHVLYHGQTTLGMFDPDLGAHRFGDVAALQEKFPKVFKDSGLSWP